jgi:hypothetical protein
MAGWRVLGISAVVGVPHSPSPICFSSSKMAAAVAFPGGAQSVAPYFKGFGQRGIQAGGAQGYELATVDQNLRSWKFQARERPLPSGYDQVLDWTDLQSQYEGMVQPVMNRTLTAAMLNQRGRPIIDAAAPMFATNQNNFVLTHEENFEIPFSLMESHGIPVISGHKATSRNVSLQPFKRATEIDLQTLSDSNFGQEALAQAMASLATSALLTVMRQVAIHIVWTPFRHMSRAFVRHPEMRECARQLHFESHLFALANDDLASFVNEIRNLPTSTNNVDLVFVPEGTGSLVQEISVETRPLGMYQVVYDPTTQRYIELLYEGVNSLATFTGAEGRKIDVMELTSFRNVHDQPEHEAFQSLRSFPVLGEMILQPNLSYNSELSGDAHALKVWVHNQTAESIAPGLLDHAEALKWAGFWNKTDGTTAADVPPGERGTLLHTIMQGLKQQHQQEAVRKYFEEAWDGRDNNTPNAEKTTDRKLTEMETFREHNPFVTRDLSPPTQIGDIEPRMLSNEFLERAAECIIQHGAVRLGFTPNALRVAVREWIVGTGNGNGDAALKAQLNGLLKAYIPKHGLSDNAFVGVVRVSGQPSVVLVPMRAHLATQANETLDQYVSAFSLDTLRGLSRLETPSGVAAPVAALTAALVHVPSLAAPLRDYLTFAYQAQAQLAAATTADTKASIQRGVETVLEALRTHAGKTTVSQVLNAVAKTSGDLGALAGKSLITARVASEAQPLQADALAFALLGSRSASSSSGTASAPRGNTFAHLLATFTSTRAVDNAMDIDALGAPPANFVERGGQEPFNTAYQARVTYGEEDSMDPLTSIVFIALISAENTWRTHEVLARKLGIQLVRLNFARPFQRYRMLSIAACRGGGAAYKTAIGHPLVNSSMQGIQGYLQIVASFRLAVLPIEPAFTRLLPHVICNGFLGGCNTDYVRTGDEFRLASPHKPSVIVLPVPIDETLYHFPVHGLNGDIYPHDQLAVNVPLFKHSGAQTLMALGGNSHWHATVNAAWENWDYTSDKLYMSLAWHRGHAWLWDPLQRRYVEQAGTGPRGASQRCYPSSAPTWAGHGSKFDKTAPSFNFAGL